MNCIAVIACLALLCGSLLASDSERTGGAVAKLDGPTCENCTESSESKAADPNKAVGPSEDISKEKASSNNSVPVDEGTTTEAPADSSSANSVSPDAPTTIAPPTTTSATTSTTITSAPTSTTVAPTTVLPTTVSPTNGTTIAPVTTSTTPLPSSSTSPPNTSPKSPGTTVIPPTTKPANDRRFDGPSFIGGIVFALGVTAIAFVAWKFYKARTERNYHTL